MHLCPQFHLFIEEDCHAVIELRQPSARTSDHDYMSILPIVCGKADRAQNVILQPRLKPNARFTPQRSAVIEFDLKAEDGPFAIVPCTWEAGWESQYWLDVYTSSASELHPCSDTDLPRDAVTGEVLTGEAYIRYETEDGHKDYFLQSHTDAYRAMKAQKCVFCSEPIMHVSGKFSGSYFQVGSSSNFAE